MAFIDFIKIVRNAWDAYDDTREITNISDISAKVSTNHVYRIQFTDRSFIVGKLSYFGFFEHFVEDHTIINALSNNLPAPFENFLSRCLMKGSQLYVYRHKDEVLNAWVVFYRPIKTRQKLPRRLSKDIILELAVEFAHFHRACHTVRHTLPPSSKTGISDINHLREILNTPEGQMEHQANRDLILEHCNKFEENCQKFGLEQLDKIPVFVDWNIGNFSVTPTHRFFSRWDYDWFRISSRMMDFYFISRVVSDVGDRTVFSYNIEPMMEERFITFLRKYHEIYPFTENEIRLLPEVYRFFILNYVVKDGRYFFHEIFARKLQAEAFYQYLPSIENFDTEPILKALGLGK